MFNTIQVTLQYLFKIHHIILCIFDDFVSTMYFLFCFVIIQFTLNNTNSSGRAILTGHFYGVYTNLYILYFYLFIYLIFILCIRFVLSDLRVFVCSKIVLLYIVLSVPI